MAQKGVNIEDIKVANRSSIIRLLLKNGSMSRSDIASALHLTPATVSIICGDFLSQNLIIQHDCLESSKVGRKKCPIEINYDCKKVIAINIHSEITHISICNLKGSIINELCIPNDISPSPDTFLATIISNTLKLLWNNKIPIDSILGAGVTIIGPVDHDNGISLNAFSLWNEPVNIKERFEQELGVPVCVESNVCAFAHANLLYTDMNAQNILIAKWGPGVGSASIISGHVFKGKNFQSAELGHNFVDRQGKKCRCGKRGCLETKLSIDAITEKIMELSKNSSQVINDAIKKFGTPTRENINKFFKVNDKDLQQYLDSISYELAVVVNNAIQILAPDKLILFGDFFGDDIMTSYFKKHLFSINETISEDMFLKSPFSASNNHIGAVSIVVKKLLVDVGGF